SKTSESITVAFPEVPGAMGYIIRAETKTGTFFSETLVSSSPGTMQGLQPYTEYEISILSKNAGGRSQPSYPVDQRTVVVAPSLNTSSPSNTSIEATWEPVDHAVEYIFVIIEEGTGNRIDINTTQTILELDNLQAGTNYTIKVQALDDEGRLGDAQTFSQLTRPATPKVLDVRIDALGRSGTTVFWLAVPGAASYTVTTSNNQTCTATFYSFCYIMPVFCGQNETVIVTAYNEAGASNPSELAEFLTYPCPPNNTLIEEYGPGNCSVVWDEVQMAQYYMTYVKWNDDQEKICNTTGTTCMFECACGYTFISFVIPYNKVGGSPIIELFNYTSAPCCPDSLNITLVSTETVEIEWTEGRGAELYQVTAEETNDIIHCNDTEPLCALSDLECDTTYSIKVTPCSEISGCNKTCTARTQVTAPCTPEVNDITQVTSSTYRVHFSTPNRVGTTYTITAKASGDTQTYKCESSDDSCDLTNLPCGTIFKVMGVAKSTSGERSLLGYEKTLETGPCCPDSCEVTQETQAMTNVSWSSAVGRGTAKCHTVENHCLMGCITCSTNYTVSMEAISSTGHKSECSFQGFSSSPCCPTHIKLYTILNNNTLNLRVSWRPQSALFYRHSVEVTGNGVPLNCDAAPGQKFCDVVGANCGVVYTVQVAPVLHDGTKVSFCQERTYSGECEFLTNHTVLALPRKWASG
uniref:Fibronectin type III domain containing 7a n=1 Tax=Neogobius melanostomus TaxID=47308 RepID=A0A8C6WRG5_9GOBI